MKKLFTLIVAVSLILGVAGNAAAYFDADSTPLTLSVWNRTTNIETGYDLGTITSAFLAQENETLFSGADFSDTAAFAAIYSSGKLDGAGSLYGHYWAIARDTTPGFSMSNLIGFQSAVTTVWNVAYGDATGPQVQVAASGFTSASTRIGQAGDYAGILTGLSTPADQPRLAALATDAYVDYYLYAYPDAVTLYTYTAYNGIDPITGQAADYAARIRLQDGDIIINPVPVPAGVWLLGSGLLALVGIRRKKA